MAATTRFFQAVTADRDERPLVEQAAVFHTELGWMLCVVCRGRLTRNSFGYHTMADARAQLSDHFTPVGVSNVGDVNVDGTLTAAVTRLSQFARDFADPLVDLPLDLDDATPFQRRVLEACRKIPSGATVTYAELARRCRAPGAARAVGNTMARNRFPLIIPCHRVVASGGKLGGYSAPDGLDMKRRLLAAEARRHDRPVD